MGYTSVFTNSKEQIERIYSYSHLSDDVAERHPDFKAHISRTASFVLKGIQEHFPNSHYANIEAAFEEFLSKGPFQVRQPSGIVVPSESPEKSTFSRPSILAQDEGPIQSICDSLVRERQKLLSQVWTWLGNRP
jgi:hypothetical protein